MQHRIKRDPALYHLVSEYESRTQKGGPGYFEDKDYFQLIQYYETEETLDKALEVVERALVQYEYRSDFYVIKARLLMLLRDYEEALHYVEIGENISPFELELKLVKARLLSLLSDHTAALELIEKARAVADHSELADVLLTEAYIHEHSKNFEAMYASLKEVLRLDPENEKALERLFMSVELSKNYRDSVEFHEWLIGQNPYSYHAWYNLGHAYACLGEYADAIEALEYSFLINEEFEMGYKDCAELCFQVQQYRMALKVYLEAIDKFGYDSELLSSAGQCFIELGQFLTAKLYLEKASKIDPYNDEVYYNLALCFAHEEKWAHAISYYIKSIQIEDRREEYYAGLAFAYEKVEDYTKADYYYAKATEAGPEQPGYWFMHARFLLSIGAVDAAWQVLEEAEFHTYGAQLLYCRAAYYYLKSDYSKGLEWLKQALSESPEQADLFHQLCPGKVDDREFSAMLEYFRKT